MKPSFVFLASVLATFLLLLATLCLAAGIQNADRTAIVIPLLVGTLLAEKRLTLSQAAKLLGVNVSTVWRWVLKGVRGVKLETFSIGAKRFTTSESLVRFSERCTAVAAGEQIPSRTQRQRQRDIDLAEKDLANS